MSDTTHRAVTQIGPSMAPKLEITKGENTGEVYRVKMRTRIGRERDNDVILLDLKSSRYHAEIALENTEWMLADLNSANGTLHNGQPVTSVTRLQHGDHISIGGIDLVFKLPGEPDVTPGPPPPAEVPRRGEASAPVSVAGPKTAAGGQPSKMVWIIGGAILLLCVVTVFVVYLISSRVSSPGNTTAENVTPVATQQSTTGSTDDNTPVNPPPVQEAPGRPADLALVYEDDFSDSFGGWDDAFDAYTRKVYGNNRYNIEVFASNLVAWGLANRIVSDFEVEVEAKLEEGNAKNSYGLIFRFEDRENFYRYDISGDGYFLFSKFIDGEWVTLVDWTQSEFVNPAGATNILKVSAFGPNITLWANGQPLATATDDSLTRGNFGFFTGTFSEPYSWVSYDNLKMWTPPDEEIVLIPTATPPGAGAVVAEVPSPTSTAATEAKESELAEGGSGSTSPVATPTRMASPTPRPLPTATPEPLPAYVSRDQTLARGETEATGRIAFPVFDAARGTYNIYMADISDGDNLTLVQADASQPALNDDGSEIAYRSWQPDKRGLYARTLKGNPDDAWRFDEFFESARPQYSVGDSTLMYHSRTGGKEPAVYQVVDGKGEVKRRDGAPIQGKSPKWSPDGQQFIYNGCLRASCGIVLSNIDGSGPVLLTDQPNDTNPEISPDGASVLFMSDRAGNWEIYHMDINGENLQALSSDKASDGLPTWSPDGSRIAFVSNRDGEWGMWIMNPDGSNKRRQFEINGAVDGIVQHDVSNSFGWVEENIDWVP